MEWDIEFSLQQIKIHLDFFPREELCRNESSGQLPFSGRVMRVMRDWVWDWVWV